MNAIGIVPDSIKSKVRMRNYPNESPDALLMAFQMAALLLNESGMLGQIPFEVNPANAPAGGVSDNSSRTTLTTHSSSKNDTVSHFRVIPSNQNEKPGAKPDPIPVNLAAFKEETSGPFNESGFVGIGRFPNDMENDKWGASYTPKRAGLHNG